MQVQEIQSKDIKVTFNNFLGISKVKQQKPNATFDGIQK